MKRIFTILVAVLLTASVFAQTPEKMTYQAVVRDASDNLVINTNVGMQISILQTSATGTAVYVETQTPSTNANGLVTIEIGTGTVVSGAFSAINWANDNYFIKTETDPVGGTNYTITGTSQLLSVPYALHAKTAESITGGINETDPVYTVSQASNITSSDITNLSNLSGVNTGDQDGSETKVTAGTNITITGTGTPASPYVINSQTYQLGDFAQGGIVFWVDETGQHGLVSAKSDQDGGSGIRWYAGTDGVTRATGDGIFAGETNTAIIIASQVSIGDDGNDYAAQICNDLQITEGGKTYGDWYLPSKEELNLMCQNKATINTTATNNGGSNFAAQLYWSSSEYNDARVNLQNFDSDYQTVGYKSITYRLRAIRSF